MRNNLFIVLIFISQLVNGQFANLGFEHISINEGLSQSEVNCIYQDNKGYMWIGTVNGLNRYDGYRFTVYKHSVNKDSSISNSHIRSIHQDKKGNLWVATIGGGLNLYNYKTGNFKAFLNSDTVENSFPNNEAKFIFESKRGLLLFGSKTDFCMLSTNDPLYTTHPSFKKGHLDYGMNSIVESDTNIFWLASSYGVTQIKIENEIPVVLNEFNYDHNDINNRIITSKINIIYIDKDSIIWAGTDLGLIKFINKNGKFTFANYQFKNGSSSKNIDVICEDGNNNFWVGTRGGGLILFDRSTNKFTNYKSDIYFENSISFNSVKCIYEDQTGILWFGTLGGGLNKIDLKHDKFVRSKIVLKDSRVLPSNYIRSIYKDDNDIIWIGTLDDGFFKYDRKENTFSNFDFVNLKKETVKTGYNVFDFEERPDNKLWIATSCGLCLYNKNTGNITYFRGDWNNPDSLKSSSVFNVENDDNGDLWVGTWNGLHKLIYENNKVHFVRFVHEQSNPESLSNDIVRYIYNDPINTDMWIGTMFGGLDLLLTDPISGKVKFVNFCFDKNIPHSLSNNRINMILRSKKGDLWVATDDGLNKLVIEQGQKKPSFVRYFESDGLPSNSVQSILEDSKGNLWLGTNYGLSKFNPETEVFVNYDREDGLQSNEFSEHTCFKSENGEMFFGGTNGFNSFYPDSIKKNMFKPKVVITNLLISNKPVGIGDTINGRVILKTPIDETKEITLSYKENIITFEFAALHFSSPNKNKYAYQLDGFNSDWLYTDAQNRKATYTNLAGGEYVFRVIASNNDGVWNNEGTSLKIKIIPPWWKTTWFTISLFLSIIGLALGFYLWRIREFRNQHRILEIKVHERTAELQEINELLEKRQEEIEAQDEELRAQKEGIESINNNLNETNIRLEERQKYIEEQSELLKEQAETLSKQNEQLNKLNATKDKFFSIIAHDLKNPFNSILGFMDLIITRFDTMEEKEKKSLLTIAYQSAQNIFKLLEDLLQWSRSQTGSIKFTPEKFLLNEIVEGNFNLVSEFAIKKGITLEKNIQEGVYMHADKNMINTVVRNLLNNSIKFTGKGVVKLLTQKTKDAIIIEISDTGVGMLPEKIDSLFSIEKNKSTQGTGGESGTGLGLIICKDFIDKHNGSITVQSELGKGTTFTIKIPFNISVEKSIV